MQPSKTKKVKGIDPNFDYKKYWESRYASGKNSGAGSYGKNAEFKAKVIDRVVAEYGITSIGDFGCGDGNQISLIKTQVDYTGYDISPTTIKACQSKFSGDKSKQFYEFDPMTFKPDAIYDMTMCLDCLFHITKEEEWLKTIDCICRSAERVVLLVTNTEVIPEEYFPHVNFKRKILPVLDKRPDVCIEEVITQSTHPESNSIVLRKVDNG